MLCLLNNACGVSRHFEIVPSGFQWTRDRNERTSAATQFFAQSTSSASGHTSNIQRITGISGTITANFYLTPGYSNINPYFGDDSQTLAILFMSFEKPTISAASRALNLLTNTSNIETSSNGKVYVYNNSTFVQSVRLSMMSKVRRFFPVQINYNGGGLNSSNFYWINQIAYSTGVPYSKTFAYNGVLEFSLKDTDGSDVVLTDSSDTTSEVVSHLFPGYTISNPTSPLAGTPIRGSWPSSVQYIKLVGGNNYIDIANGLYIWFKTGFTSHNDPIQMTIYNDTFFSRRGNTAGGQTKNLSNTFYI